MRVHGKQYRAAVATLEPQKLYSEREAVDRVKAAAFAKFDESVDVAVRLGVDPKHADQIVRGTVSLPHGTGKKVRVLVIAHSANRWALEHLLNGRSLAELVAVTYDWQEGWHFRVPAGWAGRGQLVRR